jgi:hypothetical protein
MDKVVTYQAAVRRVLEAYATPSQQGDVETEVIADEAGDHYLLVYVGWRGNQRVRGCTMHLDIKGGKVWIQHDGTERGLASELMELGVPREDIVLGFRAPARRKYTEFAES